ncbi:alpha/beta hydrolase [Bradyrhizobium sp. AUGA SZCCT0240]|uniref:alpha/beta fold hydrolase n=1 Tax=unclassified Bradyrhizobium TaxID=2631580 RepID=UPI001BA684EB|nr:MULTISPECIES: alpha/beta hydrolase [unclassified Bradyrhizobium]MBR1199625.1 alpha/beta hydrolase [Bradyrhizobium sp. AUGA SZCCT0158]MBR1243576.1 alpha/beta hydrolase [Bradyrhizobium sp. AUGA SZCCT0274]MBR1248384.1 alpha/beta hydrolase [Bradyrhizobium sp. AUGA SZCCT0169]MBR1256257.1 alpha/beta hydrolase [Bradyrhizobium sp. AUGA SZCCT0240]
MDIASDAPQSRYFQSQGLKLHFTDWGNASAPPLLLVHGGLDHSRSWDYLARALAADFHVVAPDLRGHGDSGWAFGSSYSLADHVYDLTGLVKAEGFGKVAIVGHSMGGMVSLTYAGAFPERVSKLVVLDGVTNFPARRPKPADVRITDWAGDLDKLAQRKIHRYPTVADGADRIVGRNPRLTREQALHLATHGMKRNDDGSFSWKYDPYLRARAPYRLSLEDNIGLWSRIACPTLLVAASESFLPDPEKAGVMSHFRHAELAKIAGAGHWLQHDRPDEVLGLIQRFLTQS